MLFRWTLEEAVSFGCAAAPARLEYVEEPTRHAADVGAFFAATGVPVALDESVDEGVWRSCCLLAGSCRRMMCGCMALSVMECGVSIR